MNAEIFAEWLRRRNFRVVRTASSYWVNLGKGVYQAFPYHWLIQPEENELNKLFHIHNATGLRYSTSVNAPSGCLSYHVFYDRPSYDLTLLRKKARYDVRQGLTSCLSGKISFQQLANEGWPLVLDTLERQGRHGALSFKTWHLMCMAAAGLPGFEAWGALIEDRLAAAAITFQMEDCCYILYQQSLSDYHPKKINNALGFIITREMIARPGITSVFYGLHSLDAPASVDEFKFRMGYVAKPVRQRVVFHPWLTVALKNGGHAVISKLSRWYPGNPTLSKAEGMVRFYLEGDLPLNQQRWPECLVNQKYDLCGILEPRIQVKSSKELAGI
jgi:hypothetical protein